jgi:hypothetical protein
MRAEIGPGRAATAVVVCVLSTSGAPCFGLLAALAGRD